ncbi:TPA: Tn3 family transposase, partial [Shigella sonnei]
SGSLSSQIKHSPGNPGRFNLHDKKLFIKGKADQYPALHSLISPTRINLKEIEIHWREVLRLATSIKQGTVTASLMLRKLASYPKQ